MERTLPEEPPSIPEGVLFRMATREDLPLMLHVTPKELGMSDQEDVKRTFASILESSKPFFVAFREDNLIGFWWAKRWKYPFPSGCSKKSFEVCRLYVVPEERGSGLAGQLLSWGMFELRQMGSHKIYSRIFVDNTASIHSHEKTGFTIIGTAEQGFILLSRICRFHPVRSISSENRDHDSKDQLKEKAP